MGSKNKFLLWRFWFETGMATISAILLVLTLAWKEWIEKIFGIDPDSGNGSLEWLIVGVLLVVTISLIGLARYEWRRVRTNAVSTVIRN